MDPQEEGVTHPATPPEIIGRESNEYKRRFNWQQTDLERTIYARRKCDWER